MLVLSIFCAIITTVLSYDDSYSKGGWNGGGGGGDDVSIAIIDPSNGGSGGYPDSNGGGHSGSGAGVGGYDYTPSHESHGHHEHHEHHPEPPKGHWEQKLKWKEEWVKESKTVKKQSHETKWYDFNISDQFIEFKKKMYSFHMQEICLCAGVANC